MHGITPGRDRNHLFEASLAWIIFGATLAARTDASDGRRQSRLSSQWGGPQAQIEPGVQAVVARDPPRRGLASISYLRLVVGLRFAAIESGIAQLMYPVLFSWALFVAMQTTAKIRWSERFISS